MLLIDYTGLVICPRGINAERHKYVYCHDVVLSRVLTCVTEEWVLRSGNVVVNRRPPHEPMR